VAVSRSLPLESALAPIVGPVTVRAEITTLMNLLSRVIHTMLF